MTMMTDGVTKPNKLLFRSKKRRKKPSNLNKCKLLVANHSHLLSIQEIHQVVNQTSPSAEYDDTNAFNNFKYHFHNKCLHFNLNEQSFKNTIFFHFNFFILRFHIKKTKINIFNQLSKFKFEKIEKIYFFHK